MSTSPLPREIHRATLLLPCDGTSDALLAVRHAVDAFRLGDVLMIHLLNVQPPFSAYVARHIDRELRADFHRARADEALTEARQLLDDSGVPYRVHSEVGDRARCIAHAARRLRCDRIVVGTARKSALVRAVGNSLTSQLLESSPVPVEVVGGAPAGALERVGIPAGVGAGVAWLLVGGT
ncbi:MAG: putative universal stress protein UspA [Ramlibacter sp.]|jgi:nucleotide-binding universal stress UspA family protein|nr:putative universal stress protein UspA [Ramlibacter sp.]MCE3270350.1 putative universal stress protein UspA [Ramlibacter sp.]